MSDAIKRLDKLIHEALEQIDDNPGYLSKVLHRAFLLGVERQRELQKEDAANLSGSREQA